MLTEKQNKNELLDSFIWFEREPAEKIIQSCIDFWETNISARLYSLTSSNSIKEDLITKYDSFYTHKIPKGGNQYIIIRFSSEFVKTFLEEILGKVKDNFSLFDLTDLEVKILNSYAQYIAKNLDQYFTPKKDSGHITHNEGNYNLTVLIKTENSKDISKIVISIPKNLISPKVANITKNFVTDDFLKVSLYGNLVFGKTKISLNSLKNISEGDYILLEDSSTESVIIETEGIKQKARIKPDLTLVEEMPEDFNNNEGEDMTKNIWDDIQVDASAEFQKIKMTLGDLKQISNGVVIDIDDVFKGKINLVVEDKIVAKGDLVIINDKYGVRIDEVIPSAHSQKQTEQVPQIKTIPNEARPLRPQGAAAAQQVQRQRPAQNPQQGNIPPQAKPHQAEETENFDYSNFEEDGDIK